MNKILIVLLAAALFSGCATAPIVNVNDDRPYVADNITIDEHEAIELPPMAKFQSTKEAVFKLDAERRALREIVAKLDMALGFKHMELKHLVNALRAMEIEARAIERMLIRTEAALQQEQKDARINNALHEVKQLLLIIGIGLVAL